MMKWHNGGDRVLRKSEHFLTRMPVLLSNSTNRHISYSTLKMMCILGFWNFLKANSVQAYYIISIKIAMLTNHRMNHRIHIVGNFIYYYKYKQNTSYWIERIVIYRIANYSSVWICVQEFSKCIANSTSWWVTYSKEAGSGLHPLLIQRLAKVRNTFDDLCSFDGI